MDMDNLLIVYHKYLRKYQTGTSITTNILIFINQHLTIKKVKQTNNASQ
jgi:hypothetical protein